MPSYKDETAGTWYCKFYYTNWQGEKKQKLKRGFKLQREAKDWERNFLEQYARDPDITFETLFSKYKSYITPRIRASTAQSRFYMLEHHVLPFFRTRIVSDITPADVAAWQTEMLNKNLSGSYIHSANTYLKAIFSYAVDYLGLSKNPCTKPIGSTKSRKLNFWTPEEYARFSAAVSDNPEYFIIFEILYYTGMRVGELLALTLNDIDFKNNLISINKTFYRLTGQDVINPPKTSDSERVIDIPEFLTEEIRHYVGMLYKPDPEARLFNKQIHYIRAVLKNRIAKAGVKEIRVHDIRHSHASMLINLGANPVLVAERLGHESPSITMNTYAHLFPKLQHDIVQKIQKAK